MTVKEELTIEFVQQYLKNTNIELYATQCKVSFPVLKRFYDKMKSGEKFRAILVDDNHIVDGHHRYICMHILGISIDQVNWKKSPSCKIIPWAELIIELEDWDENAIIKGKTI